MRNPYGFEMSNSCLTCHFRKVEFFCQLSPAELKEFDSIKFVTAYPSDAVLFLERQKPRGVYIVCEGQVKLFFDSSEGRTLGLRIADAGEMLGLYSLMSGNPYEASAVTLRPCQIASIPTADFQDFLKRHPAHYEWVAGEMSAEYKSACDQIRNIGLRVSLAERVAGFLLEWSRRAGAVADGAGFGLHLKHDDIAEQIGLSRESVTRALTLLARLGLIKKSGSLLSIPSRMALQEFRSPQVGSPQVTRARPAGDDGLTQITRSPIQHDRLSWNSAAGGHRMRRASAGKRLALKAVKHMCDTCKSRKLIEFRPEVWVRLLGPDSETVDLPVYPRFTLCLDCGATDFTLPEREMELLREAVRRDFQLLRGAAAVCL